MNKENVLYTVIGLLLGYVVAFTFVTYVNRRETLNLAQGAAGRGGNLSPNNSGGPEDEALRAQVEQASARARENKDDFDAQLTAAELHARVGQFEESIDFLTRANELRPDDYEVVVGLGNLNYESRRWEMAERWYKEALKKRPDDVNVRTDLGLTFFLRQPSDIESALTEFRQSLQRDPRHELTLQNMTVVLTRKASIETEAAPARKKSLEEAEQMLAKLQTVNPNNEALPNLRDAVERARSSLTTPAGTDTKGRS